MKAPLLQSSSPIDQIMLEERASSFTKRSIKAGAKLAGLKMIVSMMDLTTLEGKDTPGKVAYLCHKAVQPMDARYAVPSCAAVCVYPNLVRPARLFLGSAKVHVAAVATAFPSGQMPLSVKLEDTRLALAEGADEIDMVIDRGAFHTGEFARVGDEISAVKAVCGAIHLKVIFETGELGSYDEVRFCSDLAMRAGADFIKPAPGKSPPRQRCR